MDIDLREELQFKITNGPVFPIAPAYKTVSGDVVLDLEATADYVKYLVREGAMSLMTTAGTSQFDLLSDEEIGMFNAVVGHNRGDAALILGLPAQDILGLAESKKWLVRHRHLFDAVMLIYPTRYYSVNLVVNWFYDAAEMLQMPIVIHGLPMRNGSGGGSVLYTRELVEKISTDVDWAVGIKEESMDSLDTAYEVSRAARNHFGVIVAGGSARRYMLTQHNAQTYLAGLGSFVPGLEIELFLAIFGFQPRAPHIMMMYEDRLFDVAKEVGWHPLMRKLLSKGMPTFQNIHRGPIHQYIQQTVTDDVVKPIMDMLRNYKKHGVT